MDSELKTQLNQLLSQCNQDNIDEFENIVDDESQENQDIEFANDPMKQLEAIIKQEPMDKDDDYYYVLVIDNPKDKETTDDTRAVEVKREAEDMLTEPTLNNTKNDSETQDIKLVRETEHPEVEFQIEKVTKEQNHAEFEHSMDSFLISNNAISANVPATILENEEEYQDEEIGDVTEYTNNQNMDALTDKNGIQLTDQQNLIKILTSQDYDDDGTSTIFLKSNDGINYITDGELLTNDENQEDDDSPEVIYYDADNESQFQIVKYDGSELVIEYADDSNQISTVSPSFLCECGEQFSDYDVYVKHQHQHNPAGEHLCNLCGKGFESPEILTGHMVLHNVSGLLLQCPFCDAVMKRSALTQHIKYSHNNIKPQCNVCSKTFANPNNLKRHMMIHNGVKEFECDLCLKRFSQKITMQTHRLTHLNPQIPSLACPGCDVIFKTKELLAQHIENGECPKSKLVDSEAKEELMKAVKKEVKTSLGKLLGYACSLCKRMFSIESALERHIESTHIIDPSELLCSECGEVVSSKKEMAAHILTHDKRKTVKRFECATCGKGCTSAAMLLMHERVHTNERPFSCQLCPLKFKTKTHLRTHQLTHTREKKFGCSVCMKFFALKGNLVVHLRTHTGERPYVCSECGDAFIDSKYLKKHKLKKHATENVPWNQYLKVKYEVDEET